MNKENTSDLPQQEGQTMPSSQICANCGGSGIVDSGGMTPWGTPIELPCPLCESDWDALAIIGASWKKDSSLEKWFPLTAEELAAKDLELQAYHESDFGQMKLERDKLRTDLATAKYEIERLQRCCAEMKTVLAQFEWEDLFPCRAPAQTDWEHALARAAALGVGKEP